MWVDGAYNLPDDICVANQEQRVKINCGPRPSRNRAVKLSFYFCLVTFGLVDCLRSWHVARRPF
jgi:hypothetical protein